METERFVSLREMKEALVKEVGSASPLRITKSNGEAALLYIRGFADQQTNVVLISETFGSVGLRIMEVKDIHRVEYQETHQTTGSVRILNAKWHKKLLTLLAPVLFFF